MKPRTMLAAPVASVKSTLQMARVVLHLVRANKSMHHDRIIVVEHVYQAIARPIIVLAKVDVSLRVCDV